MKKASRVIFAALLAVGIISGFGAATYAAGNTDVTQVINAGVLTADIRDASRVSVPSPSFALSAVNFSYNCQASSGTIGSNSQRLYVDNPNAANNGWTLSIAATAGATATWHNTGSTQNFDFNDPTTAGCADSADADSYVGQLSLDPTVSTLTADCGSCTTTAITKGSSTGFNEGTTDSVTLLTAASGSDDIGRWYLTGIGVSQTIPADQAVDSYSINLTITSTAS